MKGRSLLALSVLSLALACEGRQQPMGPTSPVDPSKIISDGAHGGNKDFFFLPPMVPLALHNADFELGKFNNALRPSLRIEICELNADHLKTGGLPTDATTCGAIKKTFAPGTVQLVNLPLRQNGWWNLFGLPPDGFYYVLWDTRQSNLNVNKYYRIRVFVDGQAVALGVADVDPMSSLRQWKYSLTGEVIQLVDDVMLPITFRVERGALCEGGTCNSATITNTSPTGSQSVVVDAGGGSISGARFPNGWLPSGTQCPPGSCPQSVVVTITEVNTAGNGPGLQAAQTICHPALNPKLQQFKGCFNFRTTPALQPFNEAGDQFAQPVTVAVCYELEGTGDPREKFAELYASGPNEPPHALDDVSDAGLLGVLAKDCTPPPPIGLRSSNPLIQLASTGWRKVKGGLDRVFGVKTAYAIDLGLGGIVKGFSNISPVLTADIITYTNTELTLGPGATTTSTARIVGNSHHAAHTLATGIGGLPVTFTPSGGSKLQALGSALAPTTDPVTVITNINPVVDGSPVSGGGFAPVNWTMPTPTAPGTHNYTLTADGPALGGPVTFTATVTVNAPDLVISTGAPTVTPVTVSSSGGTVQLSPWTIKNVGGAFLLDGSVDNGFYLSTDSEITTSDTFLDANHNSVELQPSGGLFNWGGPTLTIPPRVPGVYYIGILVDNTNHVAESNENNNYVSVPIIVVGPDENQFFLAGNERRMVSMQTGATWRATVTPSFAPRESFVWTDPSADRIFISAGIGYVDVQAIIGGENIAADAAATVSGFYTDPATGGSVAGTELVMNSFSFNIFPRNTTLAWNAFPGAVAYHVVVDFGPCNVPALCPASSWENNGMGNTYTAGLSHTFGFVGAQAGRWRVEALDVNGNVINTSPYVYFAYIV